MYAQCHLALVHYVCETEHPFMSHLPSLVSTTNNPLLSPFVHSTLSHSTVMRNKIGTDSKTQVSRQLNQEIKFDLVDLEKFDAGIKNQNKLVAANVAKTNIYNF